MWPFEWEMSPISSHIWTLGPQSKCWCCRGRRNSLDEEVQNWGPSSPPPCGPLSTVCLWLKTWSLSFLLLLPCLLLPTVFCRPSGRLFLWNNMPEQTFFHTLLLVTVFYDSTWKVTNTLGIVSCPYCTVWNSRTFSLSFWSLH